MADNNTSEYENSAIPKVKGLSDLVGDTAMYTIAGILGTLTLIAFIIILRAFFPYYVGVGFQSNRM